MDAVSDYVEAPPNVGWGLSGACDVDWRDVIGRSGVGTAAVALERRKAGTNQQDCTR